MPSRGRGARMTVKLTKGRDRSGSRRSSRRGSSTASRRRSSSRGSSGRRSAPSSKRRGEARLPRLQHIAATHHLRKTSAKSSGRSSASIEPPAEADGLRQLGGSVVLISEARTTSQADTAPHHWAKQLYDMEDPATAGRLAAAMEPATEQLAEEAEEVAVGDENDGANVDGGSHERRSSAEAGSDDTAPADGSGEEEEEGEAPAEDDSAASNSAASGGAQRRALERFSFQSGGGAAKISWRCGLCSYHVLAIDQEGCPLPFSKSAFGQSIPMCCPRCLQTHESWEMAVPFDSHGDHANIRSTLSNRLVDLPLTRTTTVGVKMLSNAPGASLRSDVSPTGQSLSTSASRERPGRIPPFVVQPPAEPVRQRLVYYCGRCQRRLLRLDANGEPVVMDCDKDGVVRPITCPGCQECHNEWIVKPFVVR